MFGGFHEFQSQTISFGLDFAKLLKGYGILRRRGHLGWVSCGNTFLENDALVSVSSLSKTPIDSRCLIAGVHISFDLIIIGFLIWAEALVEKDLGLRTPMGLCMGFDGRLVNTSFSCHLL